MKGTFITKDFGKVQRDVQHVMLDGGFTLIEQLLAGVLIAMIMTGVSRILIAGISNSKLQADRDLIEGAISNNIQLIQQADSLLTYESIGSEVEKKLACEDPGAYLKQKVNRNGNIHYVPPPPLKNKSGEPLIDRTIDTESAEEMAIFIYSFKIAGTKATHQEQRILELSPNFQASCLPNRT